MKPVKNGNDKCVNCGHKRFRHRVEQKEGNQVCMNMTCPCPNWVEPKNVFEQIREAELAGLRSGERMADVTLTNEQMVGEGEPMQTEEFTRLIEEQIARSTSLLIDKAKEYASDIDRLHNFKVAAQLLGGTPEQALGGFLAKHVVSVFDMINSGKTYPEAVWNEKITDSINYLLILRAMQR